jgi:hypothetical protein
LVAYSGLDLSVETALLFCFLHDLIHASPSVKSLYFNVFPEMWAFAAASAGSGANAKGGGKFRNKGTVSGNFFASWAYSRDDRGTGSPR